jgi:hypothetical protein
LRFLNLLKRSSLIELILYKTMTSEVASEATPPCIFLPNSGPIELR